MSQKDHINKSFVEFKKVPIRPVQCFSESWHLVKEQYGILLGASTVAVLLAGFVPMGILIGPMLCGLYMCYLRQMRGIPYTIGLVFDGFNYFVESLVATLILVGASIVVLVPVYIMLFIGIFASIFSSSGDQLNVAAILIPFTAVLVLIAVLSMLLYILFGFSYFLIVDKGLTGIEAVKTSIGQDGPTCRVCLDCFYS